jgi:hypothetical protein
LLGNDAQLAATVLRRIAQSYEREASVVSQSLPVDQLNAENDE